MTDSFDQSNEISFRVDWLSLTIFTNFNKFMPYWDRIFSDHFGDLVDTGRRTAFFKGMFRALADVTVCTNPTSPSEKGDYITLTMKGTACSCVDFDFFEGFLKALISDGIETRITRVDLAWDGLDFSPLEMGKFIEDNLYNPEALRTLAKRESMTIRRDPAKPDEQGNIGTSSISMGSKSSGRMIRVYDLHGFTRLEFQMRNDRAHLVLLDILFHETDERFQVGLSHLLDFIDLAWEPWKDFIGSTERARLVISKAREITAKRLNKWLGKQVAPALSVMQDIDPTFVVRLLAQGRMRDREKYGALLEQTETQEMIDEF